MSADNILELEENIDKLDREDLVDLAKRLQRSTKRTQTFESTTSCSSCNTTSIRAPTGPIWIRAEADGPYDRDSGNDYTVLAYDQAFLNLDVRNRHEFEGKHSIGIHAIR
jgi:hypothetical protein